MLGSDLLTTAGMKWHQKVLFISFMIIGTIVVNLWELVKYPFRKAFKKRR